MNRKKYTESMSYHLFIYLFIYLKLHLHEQKEIYWINIMATRRVDTSKLVYLGLSIGFLSMNDLSEITTLYLDQWIRLKYKRISTYI